MSEEKTWQNFKEKTTGKKIFIFGAGEQTKKYLNRLDLYDFLPQIYEGIIDNDERKQGDSIERYIGEKERSIFYKEICSIDVLEHYQDADVAILITSLRRYSEIEKQVRCVGKNHIWIMEVLDQDKQFIRDEQKRIITFHKQLMDKYYLQEINRNKILFYNTVFGSHGDAIIPELKRISDTIDIVCVIKKEIDSKIEGVRYIYEGDFEEYIKELETAHVWFYGDVIPEFARKKEGQICIRSKHWSSITLKSFYLDDKEFCETSDKKNTILSNAKIIDYALTGSEFDERTMASGFGLNAKYLRVGSPRSDVLFDDKYYLEIRKRYGLNGKKILLYAPTFRRVTNKYGAIEYEREPQLDYEKLASELNRITEDDWVVMYKAHPSVAFFSGNRLENMSNVINVSDYENLGHLLSAADLVVTDYSSLMFEPAYVGKPVILYAPDRDEYIGVERNLLIDYDKLPFECAITESDLYEKIRTLDLVQYKKNVREFLEEYGIEEDGHASERAAREIYKLLQREL